MRELFIAQGLLSPRGTPRGDQQHKLRQVQRFIELLTSLSVFTKQATRADVPLHILDAGCGRAYLSLALCLYARQRGWKVHMTGIDRNKPLLEQVQALASRLELPATLVHGDLCDVQHHVKEDVDLLISLHACDTATDHALMAGVQLRARSMALVPCCHRELAAQMALGPRGEPVDLADQAIQRHGLLRGRLADLLTDALRAAVLEACHYDAGCIEFISAEHTAKNLMIRASRREQPLAGRAEQALAGARELAGRYGVRPALLKWLEALVEASGEGQAGRRMGV